MSRNHPAGALAPRPTADARERALGLLQAYGRDPTSFQLLEPGFRHFFDGDAFVAYVDTGDAWVAGGGPVAPVNRVTQVARSFVDAAAAERRRASFFCADAALSCALGGASLAVGETPSWDPARWEETVASHASLRSQVRRAAARGVVVRDVAPDELGAGTSLRGELEELVDRWLAARRLAPMGFLVDLEPFGFAEERRYALAAREGRVVGFLTAVPIYARRGWLLEDLLRLPGAPNGTSEALVDHAMRRAAREDRAMVSMGLAPLAGPIRRRLRLARAVSRPLFDFHGLRAFKAKLRPNAWETAYVVAPDGGSAWRALWDGLRAFARGDVLGFGLETSRRWLGRLRAPRLGP